MSAATQFLTVDSKKKVVIINREITPAAGDSVLLTSYIAAGYTQRDYSPARAKAMKKNADGLNNEKLKDRLKDYPEVLKEYEKDMAQDNKGRNFLKAKSKALAAVKAIEEEKAKAKK